METKKINKQQTAYKVIRERILSGEYPPGIRIVINQIAKELSLSAIPIREAIRQLESDGLIVYQPNIGAVVSSIDENEYLETLTLLAVLEGYATAESADNFPKEKIKELTTINEQLEQALDELDFARFGVLNRLFHEKTYAYCENKYVIETIKNTWSKLSRIRGMGAAFVSSRSKQSVGEHRRIIKLIENNHSFSEIESFVRLHKMNTVAAFIKRKEEKEIKQL
ncbi:GntR family transcriptional regulator [Bacillus sp. FJAT-45350]|uniref:GntR family transcriptional regulator n=1 Tax=Bacillus sp. FJAT-45350 TaxID=2011014 RepID=UPI000BB8AD49|nr:GntR family transcriptional regulator [Bacillus sp. FJAT-45350]